ncbi:hypothetical protein NDU88_003555 [Pleurodeles waltl]|uniref:Uncharacterized protein n=1 Tax=Pleurodeles waltl TaxID=8319 RepID=A0AAV7VG41_PLEWA|nr:hypothetical protein NDU88_003555 [Pleurodeles waltl]
MPTNQTEQATPLEEPPTTLADAKLDTILAAIADTRHDLRNRVDALEVEVGLLCDDQPKLTAWVIKAESMLNDIQPTMPDLER